MRQVTALCGDVTEPGLGLGVQERIRLRASLDVIVHAAATTSFSTPLDVARSVNVAATRNVLAFATRASGLTRVAHVSTAFVAGKLGPVGSWNRISSTTAGSRTGTSSRSTRRSWSSGAIASCSPWWCSDQASSSTRSSHQHRSVGARSASLSNSSRGGSCQRCPGGGSTRVDLVMERDVARAITRLLLQPAEAGTYHVAGGERSPTLASIVEPYGDPRYLGVDQFAWQVSKWRHERPRLAGLFDELECFIYELAYPKIFDTTCTEAALGGPVTMEDPLASLLDEAPAAGEHVQAAERAGRESGVATNAAV